MVAHRDRRTTKYVIRTPLRSSSPWQDPSGSRAGVFGFQTRREERSDGFTS